MRRPKSWVLPSTHNLPLAHLGSPAYMHSTPITIRNIAITLFARIYSPHFTKHKPNTGQRWFLPHCRDCESSAPSNSSWLCVKMCVRRTLPQHQQRGCSFRGSKHLVEPFFRTRPNPPIWYWRAGKKWFPGMKSFSEMLPGLSKALELISAQTIGVKFSTLRPFL